MLNLDTHVLLHALGGKPTRRESRILAEQPWSISAIVLWEIAKLRSLGRIEFEFADVETRRALARIHVWPLTIEVCRKSCDLDVNSDPADELIAATSVVHEIPLLTRDRVLRASREIPLA